jgi:hypothetical protein
MTVLIGARDPGRGETAAAALRAEGIDACAITLDVTDPLWTALNAGGPLDVLTPKQLAALTDALRSVLAGE